MRRQAGTRTDPDALSEREREIVKDVADRYREHAENGLRGGAGLGGNGLSADGFSRRYP